MMFSRPCDGASYAASDLEVRVIGRDLGGEYAWLGLGTTLASHRRHGAQAALLARCLNEAAVRGARVAVTETGERQPDKPGVSYRNILRAGFQEMYLRQNYMSPSMWSRRRRVTCAGQGRDSQEYAQGEGRCEKSCCCLPRVEV